MAGSDFREVNRLIADAASRTYDRRSILRRALALSLSAPAISALLAACGGDEDEPESTGDAPTTAPDEPTAAADDPTTADSADESTPDTGGSGSASPTAGDTGSSTPADGTGGVDAEGSIVIALSVEPATLENWFAYSTDGHPVLRNVQEALLNRDPETNELVGELATAWEQVDDLTWRFTLREGVTFHDGEPFNADVAAFGINYTWSPENSFDIYQFVGPDMTATAVDEYTLDVTTETPDPILPSRLYFSPLPSKRQVEERPDSLPLEPIGTGPYKFVEWEKGRYIRLTANPDWWGHNADDAYGSVTIKDVEFVFRTESAVRAAMVTTNEAQIGRFISPEDCETVPVCETVPSVETLFLRLDTMHPAMQDRGVREAIALAIDREALVAEMFAGAEPASQIVGQSATGYNPRLEPYPYDVEKAAELVEEAAASGVAVDARISVITRTGNYPRSDEFGQYVANQLTSIGLNANNQVLEPAQFNEQAYSVPRDEVPVDRGWIIAGPHGNEIMDLHATAQSYYRCDGGASTYCDPELDDMIDDAGELTGDARIEALQAINERVHEDYAVIPVLHFVFNYGIAENFTWEPRLDSFMLLKEMAYTEN